MLSEVKKSICSRPGIGGTAGRPPVAITMLRVVTLAAIDVHRPGRRDPRIAGYAVHAEGGIALDRVVGLDFRDDVTHSLHDAGEIHR